ncbi:hypothetical protein [Clostridium oceanicum]|uniref:Uncharacterized protein n=1 Tax=Clostridium oceanicum TaxID=1543 RepID=A0ABP3UYI6_9CLOT
MNKIVITVVSIIVIASIFIFSGYNIILATMSNKIPKFFMIAAMLILVFITIAILYTALYKNTKS